ncbi:tRNA (guanosine(46)-N7)-methyltransferase TrmB [Parvularcula lutaonensis]|uniref:tRNA (guanine-N(7)-)-methyltransferase n=1 Tax=Parvularcula lutaonensis TaxID=491923 RepID=A0ABV7M900_9PROT|nr:tRNA (guanosine(46)-N7)-methyltransferase TrmB [Parvularcula lutaonensis]GGY46098.1 tRNA (guanine-N(7)-)-methyltransferase [Parvularcula lutaonensis]
MPDNTNRPKSDLHGRADGRLFGRRQDKALKPRQARLVESLLPKVSFDASDIAARIKVHDGPVFFEIGFGGGEHLAWQAEAHPEALCFGAEPFINGVAKLLVLIEEKLLENVKVLEGDARPALEAVPDGSLDKLFLLQPDPWPKKRHHKRRMVSQHFFGEAARALRPGGELRISSDIADYIRWTLMHWQVFERDGKGGFDWMAEGHTDWKTSPDDLPKTRYMAKGEAAGRPVTYLRFRRR